MIPRVFRLELPHIYLARNDTSRKKSMKLFMSNNRRRKGIVDKQLYDGIKNYLIETHEKKRSRCAGDNCTKLISSQCSKHSVALCLGSNISFHKKGKKREYNRLKYKLLAFCVPV